MVRYVGSLATMLALGVLFTSPVAGQAMTGMWQIEFEGPPGPLQVPIEFAQEGSDLTGSATMAGAEQRVTGTYEDGDLAFDIFLNFNGNAITLSFDGAYDDYPWGGESHVIPWKGGLALVSFPTADPLDGLTRLKHIEDDVFRRILDDEELGREVRFELDAQGRVVGVWSPSNFSERIR